MQRHLTVSAAAEQTGVPESVVRQLVRRRKLPGAYVPGDGWYLRADAVAELQRLAAETER